MAMFQENPQSGPLFFSTSIFNNSRKNNVSDFSGRFALSAIINAHAPGKHMWLPLARLQVTVEV